MWTLLLDGLQLGLDGPVGGVLLRGGQVIAVGDIDRRDADDVVRMQGTVLPGLRDGHVHLDQWATLRRRLDVRGARSAVEAAAAVAEAPDGSGVLVGYGFRDGTWPDAPHAQLLEAARPGKPVMLLSNDLHAAWLSPAALALLGRPEHPDGILREHEAVHAAQVLGAVGDDELDDWVAQALREAAARGVTHVRDFEVADNVTAWTRRAARAELATHVACAVYPEHLQAAKERGLRSGDVLADGTARVEVGPYKLFVDGSLNTRTALCHEPYPDVAKAQGSHGLQLLTEAELREQMTLASKAGIEPAVHAIGDRAVALAAAAFEQVGCRGRIEHAQLVAPEDVSRLARPGLVISVQPGHCPDDRDVADVAWPTRAAHAFPYADLHRAGARLELGSDAPVAPLDPWDAIASAVHRTDDERPPWHPQQALDLATALGAACGQRTSLRPGDPADLTVVGESPSELDNAGLREIPVLATMVGGRWTHRQA